MPAPTQRQILEGRRGLIPPVPVYATRAAPDADRAIVLLSDMLEEQRRQSAEIARIAEAVTRLAAQITTGGR